MTMDRRAFLGLSGALAAGTLLAPGVYLVAAPVPQIKDDEEEPKPQKRWGMLIDVTKCGEDCVACTDACRKENNVPLFGNPLRDIHWIRKVSIHDLEHRRAPFTIPMLCNHCQHPPCVHVCPTGASLIRHDGIVLIDEHRCIGCRYCMIACPYKARSLVYHETKLSPDGNPAVPIRAKGVVEKCTFCVHRIDNGQQPACVEACNQDGKAGMVFGDLNDPESEISKRVLEINTQTIRPDLGMKTQVYYQGL